MACSNRKQQVTKKLPAIERYNGPTFQVLHKFMAENPEQTENLAVYILSARFGLIPQYQLIPVYDLVMTPCLAVKLNAKTLTELGRIFANQRYDELFICAGKTYLLTMNGYDSLIPSNTKVTIAKGSLGRKQFLLRDWLYGVYQEEKIIEPLGSANIRGIKIAFSPEEIIEIANLAISEKKGEAFRYQSWYVSINGYRVAPKWLISQLTGLPVSQFHSEEARRVLQQLGIKVCSVGT